MADVSQIKLPNGSVYDLIDEKSGYITAEYIENKTDYEIPVSRVGEIVVGETAIGTDSTNFPTSKAVVDYVDERVVQEMDAIDVGVTGIKANGTSLSIVDGVVNIPAIGPNQSVGLMTDQWMQRIWNRLDSIPTSTSQLTNDSGFLTSYTETDPTVPAWAKASTKPTYTASEIGALPDTTIIPSKTSDLTNDSGFLTIDSDEKVKYVPIQGTDTNSYGLLYAQNNGTSEQTSSVYTGRMRFQPSTGTLSIFNSAGSRVGTLSPFQLSLKHNTSAYSGNLVIANLTAGRTYTLPDASGTVALTSDIPTVPTNISSFTNDSGYLTASDIASVMTYKGTKANYAALPASGNITGDVWHLTDTGAEWAWDGSAWQELGTAIDLSGYVESSRTADSTTTVFSNTGVEGSIQSTYQGTNNEAYIQTTATDDNASIELYVSDGIHYNQISIGPIETYISNILTPINNTDAANKKYVDDSVGALSIPTKTSDLTNDSGYLTSYTETDPTVPSWAKQSTKPSYGLTEISGTDDLRAIEALTGTSGLLKKTAANTWMLDTNTYLTSYTETDPVFSASAAAGITATDISNWNAKVSDDKTWNGVTLNQDTQQLTTYYVPTFSNFNSTSAKMTYVTSTPSNNKIVKWDSNSYLYSTTPSANDNSTKVATTAYVDSVIPDTSRFIPTTTNTTTINARDGFTLYQYDNTSTGGFRRLSLGNEINYKTSGGAYGVIRFYDSGQYYRGDLLPNLNLTGDQTWTLPNATGTIALTSDIPQVYSSTNTGGYLTMATLPIYDGTVV